MNILDVTKEVPKVPDKLEAMFEYQRKLMDKFHSTEKLNQLLQTEDIPVLIDDPKGQARLKDLSWRITEELAEAMGCLKNRPWKRTQMPTDQAHFYEELADFLHFSLELFISAGLNADTLFELYFKKQEINKFRQGSGY